MTNPPLVSVHGMLDTSAVFDGLQRELAGRRDPLLIPDLPCGSVARRWRRGQSGWAGPSRRPLGGSNRWICWADAWRRRL
jgi:hypothetical protein